jgi:hypothetical protein
VHRTSLHFAGLQQRLDEALKKHGPAGAAGIAYTRAIASYTRGRPFFEDLRMHAVSRLYAFATGSAAAERVRIV